MYIGMKEHSSQGINILFSPKSDIGYKAQSGCIYICISGNLNHPTFGVCAQNSKYKHHLCTAEHEHMQCSYMCG